MSLSALASRISSSVSGAYRRNLKRFDFVLIEAE
jgi:hypothetical protein